MKSGIFAFVAAIVVLSLAGCATEDEKRIEELRSMPVLWRTTGSGPAIA